MEKVTRVDDIDTPKEPANLRFLRRLVTLLTATMIAGLLTVIVLLVIRLGPSPTPWPDTLDLPDGATPLAVTRGPDWWAVVTTDNRILILTPDGDLRQTLTID